MFQFSFIYTAALLTHAPAGQLLNTGRASQTSKSDFIIYKHIAYNFHTKWNHPTLSQPKNGLVECFHLSGETNVLGTLLDFCIVQAQNEKGSQFYLYKRSSAQN